MPRPMRRWGTFRSSVVLACALAAAFAAPALAVPPCPGGPPPTRTLLSGQGRLESVIADAHGRLFFTDETQLLRLDRPGATPKVLVDGVDGPGGMAFDDAGMLLMGRGNNTQDGLTGDVAPQAGVLRIDPDTGANTVYATGLSMANGVARAPDGSLYATNDLGSDVDRVDPAGNTQHGWSHVLSGNGDAVDSTGRWLYVNQTFQPPAVQRVDIQHPDQVTTYVSSSDPADLTAGLDGMTRDSNDNLYLAANGGGQIWKVTPGPTPQLCLLVPGLAKFPSGPSAVAVNGRNLDVVTFGGDVIEVRGVAVKR